MTTTGKPYDARGEYVKVRNIRKHRVIYITSGVPTPEQKMIIEKIERIVSGEELAGDPYFHFRNAEYMGIDFYEEELRGDGKWHRVEDPDVDISLMQAGAL